MSNLKRKVIALFTGLTLAAMLLPVAPAQALTAEELQAQIDALLQQISELQNQLSELGAGSGGTSAGCLCTFTRNLYPEMSGDDVKCLQQYLNVSGFPVAESGAGSPGNETTYFGPLTRGAVQAWQDANGVDYGQWWGYFGPVSQARYDAVCAVDDDEEPGDDDDDEDDDVVTGDGLMMALASDNPAAATIVADSTGAADSAQSMIPFLKVKLSNGDSADVKVTAMEFTRGGISADSDISQAYVYEGDTLLAEYNSFSDGILKFSNSAGIVTIPEGSHRTITLKADLANNTASGKTIRFSLTNVTADASEDSGLPLTGNYMSTARTADVGQLTVATTTAAGSTVDPQDGLTVYNLNLTGSDQKLEVRKITFSNIGSTAVSDLKNFKLYDGGAQIGETVEVMESDKTVTFDMTDDPLVIDKGITKNLHLKADIVSGTNRTFQFSIQDMTDITVYDTGYGVYVKPDKSDSWTVHKMGISTINAGKLTLARAADSPKGNVALGGANVTVGKFDVKATGEDVKITSFYVSIYGTNMATGEADGLYQGKVYFDGSQKGSTTALISDTADGADSRTQFTFGNTFVVPADGETHTIEIKADIKDADGDAHTGDEFFTTKLMTFVATGRDSSANVTVGSATAWQLGISAGTLTAAKNQAVADWTSVNPTAVPGATDVLVGSFVVTAGASEGADITSIVLQYATTTGALQNLRLYQGTMSSGTQIGSNQSSVTVSTNYTFYPTPYVSLGKSEQVVLNVYADVLSSASAGDVGYIQLGTVSGVGKVTNSSVNTATTPNGQTLVLASNASLTLSAASDQTKSVQIIMDSSDVEFNKVKFLAGAGEDVEVTQAVVTATLGGSAPTSTVKNIELWDGSTQIGSTAAALSAAGTATFNLSADPWVIPASEYKTLTIKADINNYSYASSGADVKLGFADGGITARGKVSGVSAGDGENVLGKAMYTYKTKLTFDENSETPSGASFTGSAKEVLRFDITNNGPFDGYLNAATFTLEYTKGTGNATTAATRTATLYDASDLTTPLGTGAIDPNTDLTDGTADTVAITLNSAEAIAPGETPKIFVLKFDTRDCGATSGSNAGSQLKFYINSGTDVNWDDNVSEAVQSALSKEFPVDGGTLEY